MKKKANVNILWLSWKDEGHPEAGGAEKVSGEIRRRLIKDGHSVTLITTRYVDSHQDEVVDGVKIHRTGSRYTVYPQTWQYCRKVLKNWPDVVIDEMNTIPFAASLYFRRIPVYLLAYQLARQVWFYQMRFPLSVIGYLIEPVMLFILARAGYRGILTESESTKSDMQKYGFQPISIFPIWLDLPAVSQLDLKKDTSTILSLGAVRPMKRTLHAIKAFEVACHINPKLQLLVAGDTSSKYAGRLRKYVEQSPYRDRISLLGRVSNDERIRLMRDSAIILVTSVKEGWGLIVTEANSQGTPAVVYDVDGLRDSVKHLKSGIISKDGDPAALGTALCDLLDNPKLYEELRENAWEWSKEFTFENSYREFCKKTNIS